MSGAQRAATSFLCTEASDASGDWTLLVRASWKLITKLNSNFSDSDNEASQTSMKNS